MILFSKKIAKRINSLVIIVVDCIGVFIEHDERIGRARCVQVGRRGQGDHGRIGRAMRRTCRTRVRLVAVFKRRAEQRVRILRHNLLIDLIVFIRIIQHGRLNADTFGRMNIWVSGYFLKRDGAQLGKLDVARLQPLNQRLARRLFTTVEHLNYVVAIALMLGVVDRFYLSLIDKVKVVAFGRR